MLTNPWDSTVPEVRPYGIVRQYLLSFVRDGMGNGLTSKKNLFFCTSVKYEPFSIFG